MLWIEILILVVGLAALIVGGELLVRGAANLAYSIQISPLVVGLTVVAFGTSAPELIISLKSALAGVPNIAMGNVVGSNICNLTLVMGATAVIYPVFVEKDSIRIDWVVAIGASGLLYFFISKDYLINRFEGIIFVLVLIIFTYFLIEKSRRETRDKIREKLGIDPEEEIPSFSGKGLVKEIGFLLLGSLGLFFGAQWFVDSASNIASTLGVSDRFIGLTIVSIGTSLPELVASGMAALKKNTEMAMGNLLGSNIFNILSILGFTSIVTDIQVSETIVSEDIYWMFGATVLLLPMMITRRRISKFEGVILLLFYAGYMYWLVASGGLKDLPV